MGVLIKRKPIIRRVLSSGGYDDAGEWVEGSGQTDTTIYATVQPMKPKEMLSLPEGRRERQSYVLYTDTRLNTLLENNDPDRVIINTNEYEVVKRYNWKNSIINHYKYGVVRLTTK